MNTRYIKKNSTEEEIKEIKELYQSSSMYRELLSSLIQEEIDYLTKKLTSLSPSFVFYMKYYRIVSQIKAKEDLLKLIKG